MFGGIGALIGAFIVSIIQANKKFGKIESKKIRYTHVLLLVFSIIITGLSLNILFQMVFNFESTLKVIYVENGFFSPLINTIMLSISTIVNMIALYAIFSIANRSEKARKLFIYTLPILFILGSIRSINEIIAKSEPDASLSMLIVIMIVGLFISYFPMFFFYRNKNVRNIIFNTTDLIQKDPETAIKA
jgi:ABC-type Fe3+ transport system permease subunit